MDESMLIGAEAFANSIWPKGEPLTRETVDSILGWEFPVAVHAQIRELREKNSEGEITSQELELLDRYRRAGQKIDIMKAKAKLFLLGKSID